MAAYAWKDGVLSINFAEDGAEVIHTLALTDLSETVKAAALQFGLQTVLRNATAGKMDDVQDAIKAQATRLATLKGGLWTEQRKSADAVALSAEEQQDIMARVITDAYMAKPGNTKTRAQLLDGFNGLPEEQQQAVLAALKPQIDKALKAALAARKKASKSTAELPAI